MANRYFVDQLPQAGHHVLRGEVAHHLATVLRCRPGDQFVLADGRGGSALATVTGGKGRELVIEVAAAHRSPSPRHCLHVAFAPPKLQRAEWLFEHGTEVGIDVFWPLWTSRTRPQGDRRERWQKIATAAAGQCDRDWLPTIGEPQELAAWLERGGLPVRRFVGDAAGQTFAPADAVPGEALLLVGPEGGFDAAEAHAIAAAGFLPRRFGSHVLRTETAALVGAALWHAAAQD